MRRILRLKMLSLRRGEKTREEEKRRNIRQRKGERC